MTPLTSIVILTRNELAYTRRCVESIARWTPEPHELIFVDNGSTDGTLEYLRDLPQALVIANEENLGFAGGCNQGMAVARGERILLLNNDTMATPGWLAAMHRALDAEPRRGIVGPRSNHVAGDQLVNDVGYDVETAEGLEEFARDWSASHVGQGRPLPRLIGFCLLVRRDVVERIGGFDLAFGPGNFEDDDFCLRAGVAGFENWMCDEAFVHHFGSRTFTGSNIDYESRMETAWQHFARKWHPTTVHARDGAIAGYETDELLARTIFDSGRHYIPLFASTEGASAVVHYDAKMPRSMLALADRHRPELTGELLACAIDRAAAAGDMTLVVRIDPRDRTTLSQLEAIADARHDALPDIVLLEASDHNDEAVMRAIGNVYVHPAQRLALWEAARSCGAQPIDADRRSLDQVA